MQSVPTHADLIAAIGQRFVLGTADGRSVEARLAAAPAGIPMDETYVCYVATFELPAGVQLPQDVYLIAAPDGRVWELLATPTRPAADGRATLTAVMHCLAPDAAQIPAAPRSV